MFQLEKEGKKTLDNFGVQRAKWEGLGSLEELRRINRPEERQKQRVLPGLRN